MTCPRGRGTGGWRDKEDKHTFKLRASFISILINVVTSPWDLHTLPARLLMHVHGK